MKVAFPHRMRRAWARIGLVLAFASAAAALGGTPPALAGESAVVFMYHRFGETNFTSTNIRIEQFEAHIKELVSRRFNVIGLPEIVAAVRAGRTLPDRTVGISIDDAFLSVYAEAWPRLKAAGLPFTLFVATDAIDRKSRSYMTWDQIRELELGGVTIGSQTGSHLHMPLASNQRNADELKRSNARFMAELGELPKLFAYPYGEYTLAARKHVEKAGFIAAFGQHSGVLHPRSNPMFLPRFAMNEAYGDVGRFRLAANALPLAVAEITPVDPLLSRGNNPPSFGFTVSDRSITSLASLSCYASGQGKARIERLGKRRIEVRMERAFPAGRARINCTMPAAGGRWRWFGFQFYVPKT